MKVKVLIVHHEAWSALNYRLGMIKGLKQAGYDVAVAAAPLDDAEEELRKHCHYIPLLRLNVLGMNPLKELALIKELYTVYKNFEPDFIMHYTVKPNTYGNLVAGWLGIPSIATVNGLGRTFSRKGLLNKVVRILFAVSLRKVVKVIFQNNDDRQMFLDLGLIDERRTLRVPGSGVNTKKFVPQSREQDGVFRYLLGSRLVWDKGIKEYASAGKIVREKFPDSEFLLLGPHTDKGGKDDVPQELIDKWVQRGWINYGGMSDDMPAKIAQADVVVLPSFYREGVPRILLEAISMGKPIVTTNHIGCKETVDDGVNGILIPVRDADALAEACLKMLQKSEQELQTMGQKSREKALNEFDEQLVIQVYVDLIKQTVLKTT